MGVIKRKEAFRNIKIWELSYSDMRYAIIAGDSSFHVNELLVSYIICFLEYIVERTDVIKRKKPEWNGRIYVCIQGVFILGTLYLIGMNL